MLNYLYGTKRVEIDGMTLKPQAMCLKYMRRDGLVLDAHMEFSRSTRDSSSLVRYSCSYLRSWCKADMICVREPELHLGGSLMDIEYFVHSDLERLCVQR